MVDPLFLLNVLTTVLLAFLSIAGTIASWYVRKYVLSEVEKNTQFRKWLAGADDIEQDEGVFIELQQMHAEMKMQHEEAQEKLDYCILYLQRLSRVTDAEVQEPPRKWSGGDTQDFFRGGRSESGDD